MQAIANREPAMTQPIGVFSTATDMLVALRAREISSSELVEMHLTRIAELDGQLNAIPVRTADRARDAAKRADAAIARGVHAPLLGLPMTLKESTQIAGLPQTAGVEELKNHRPTTDGPVPRSVFAAGACLLGKTNIPYGCADFQANSAVYGRTNNPWDLRRTPGGSTGGGAAALAAGLTPLEIGSDTGGSIRVPAAYCGVYGHRPSETAVPRSGMHPTIDLENPGAVMSVHGPLARSAGDLELLLDAMIGPVVGEDAAWKLALPQARHTRLRDFRVAVMPEMPWVKASGEMLGKVEELASFLSQRGAKVAQAMPATSLESHFDDFLRLSAAMQPALDLEKFYGDFRRQIDARRRREGLETHMPDVQAIGMSMNVAAYLDLLFRREVRRERWRTFFADWDVLIGPMALDAAFEHQTSAMVERTLCIDGETVPYLMNLTYPMLGTLTGQPSTAFPAGLNQVGLPLGLQAIGPYLEDRTTLQFAQLLEREWQGFVPPPGY
jgi:amidase